MDTPAAAGEAVGGTMAAPPTAFHLDASTTLDACRLLLLPTSIAAAPWLKERVLHR